MAGGALALLCLAGVALLLWRSSAGAASGCDRTATPATFTAEVSRAAPGQTICLASGDYGLWHGVHKAITLTPRIGASPRMGFQFGAHAAGFTINGGMSSFSQGWGLRITDEAEPDIAAGAHDIRIDNTAFSVGLEIDGPTDANIVFNHDLFEGLDGFDYAAALHLAYRNRRPSGITVENSMFRDMSADAIQTGIAMSILGNEFVNVQPDAAGGNESLHTDAVQLYGATDDLIAGNYVHGGCEQGIGAFDGTAANTVVDNVIVGCTAHSLVMGGDKDPGSLVDHNTVIGDRTATIDCSSKPGEGPSTTAVLDNIARGGLERGNGADECRPSENTHNLFGAGGRPPNRHGHPRFVAGATPAGYFGFQLAPGSRGRDAATDGFDVGARIASVPGTRGDRGLTLPSRPKLRETRISSRRRSGGFTFLATGAVRYQCALVGPAPTAADARRRTKRRLRFHACESPQRYAGLTPGHYVFEVRSQNNAGIDRDARTRPFRISTGRR